MREFINIVENELITELTGSRAQRVGNYGFYPTENSPLDRHMESLGFSRLGYGTMGKVYGYTSNPNLVVKVFVLYDNGFMKFVDFCRRHSPNPALPKFKGKSVKISLTYRMIRIEKLDKLTDEDWNKIARFTDLLRITRKRRMIIPDDIQFFIDKYPEEANFAETLLKVANESDSNLDFHQGNFMKRGNTFVITDPY